jgi:hypothetical protein
VNHLDPRPRQRDSLADANPRDEETARLAYLLIPHLPAYRQSTTVYDLALHEVPRFTVGAGPLLVLPAASHKDIGAGKWQAGVAGIVSTKSSFGLIAAVITYQHSFSGYGSDRPEVNLVTVQPLVFYNLKKHYYLRSSGFWNLN